MAISIFKLHQRKPPLGSFLRECIVVQVIFVFVFSKKVWRREMCENGMKDWFVKKLLFSIDFAWMCSLSRASMISTMIFVWWKCSRIAYFIISFHIQNNMNLCILICLIIFSFHKKKEKMWIDRGGSLIEQKDRE